MKISFPFGDDPSTAGLKHGHRTLVETNCERLVTEVNFQRQWLVKGYAELFIVL